MSRGATVKQHKPTLMQRMALWRARLPHMVIGLLVILSLVLVYSLYARYQASAAWQIKRVRIEGELRQLDSKTLLQAVRIPSGATLLAVDLRSMTARAAALPWVKTVSIRRVFPSELVIVVAEREPWLRLNNDSMVDQDGKAFLPFNVKTFAHLPRIATDERQLPLALIQFTVSNEQWRSLGLSVANLELNPRGALRVELNNGMSVWFGRNDWESRLQRVVQLYPTLMQQSSTPPMYIDARYDTGLAVQWPFMPATVNGAVTRTAGL